jgi:hypothetical protein
MAETYEKVDANTLKIVKMVDVVYNTISRAEIQTKIDHLELDKAKIQLEIDGLKKQIAILDK